MKYAKMGTRGKSRLSVSLGHESFSVQLTGMTMVTVVRRTSMCCPNRLIAEPSNVSGKPSQSHDFILKRALPGVACQVEPSNFAV